MLINEEVQPDWLFQIQQLPHKKTTEGPQRDG